MFHKKGSIFVVLESAKLSNYSRFKGKMGVLINDTTFVEGKTHVRLDFSSLNEAENLKQTLSFKPEEVALVEDDN
jgi:hypothetical protein